MPAHETFKNYCYRSIQTGRYILPFDDARYFNHADDPNCAEGKDIAPTEGERPDIASRDIQEGEELTNDYRAFDAEFEYKMTNDIRTKARA